MADEWNSVTVLRKRGPTAAATKSSKAVNAAMRSGVEVETSKKYGAGGNAQHMTTKNTAALDRETEELHHEKVTLSVARAIQQARQAKGLTQKELSTKIAEKPQIVNEYEAGKAIPNNAILGKLERALGVKLRGKDIGKPLEPRGKGGAAKK
ncbi:endothelial differentiation-related factor 1-like [Watersipora subatra]|uniref:endothelial differentiation-related factor 1-like n=1 Tax=Watersipora subatra TaxID=2589382 RepID=UPI00355B7A47